MHEESAVADESNAMLGLSGLVTVPGQKVCPNALCPQLTFIFRLFWLVPPAGLIQTIWQGEFRKVFLKERARFTPQADILYITIAAIDAA